MVTLPDLAEKHNISMNAVRDRIKKLEIEPDKFDGRIKFYNESIYEVFDKIYVNKYELPELITLAEIMNKYKISKDAAKLRIQKSGVVPYKPNGNTLYFKIKEVENAMTAFSSSDDLVSLNDLATLYGAHSQTIRGKLQTAKLKPAKVILTRRYFDKQAATDILSKTLKVYEPNPNRLSYFYNNHSTKPTLAMIARHVITKGLLNL